MFLCDQLACPVFLHVKLSKDCLESLFCCLRTNTNNYGRKAMKQQVASKFV